MRFYCIYICIYIKNYAVNGKNFKNNMCFLFRFYILCENFSKIGPIIKKIPKFSDDPLKVKGTDSVEEEFFIIVPKALKFRREL